MRIIGISDDMFISSAALIEDGKVISAIPEERLTREKQTRKFPINALKYCLKEGKCKIEDIDYIAASWNPGIYFEKFHPLLSGRRRFKGECLYSVPDYLFTLYDKKEVEYVQQNIKLLNSNCKIYFITHHRAHAGNGFLLSPFEESAILTADAQGEFESATFGYGKGNKIEVFQSILCPQSLGIYYAAFTEFFGFKSFSDEWKVMALSAFTGSNNKYYKILKEVVKLLPEGKYELDLTYFNGYIHEQPNLYTKKFVEVFGKSREKKEELTERHYEIAAAMQKRIEDALFHMMDWLWQKTKSKNIVCSGGCFMNSVFNGKIIGNSKFENVFISSCPDDSGNAKGAALYLYNHILGNKDRYRMEHNYFGPEFSDDEIKLTMDKYNIKNYTHVRDIEKYTAGLIAQGKLVGWFQGRMEFGQRSLGNRSILVNPQKAEMKDRVNKAVKYRESFRPFAPSVMEEYAAEYFDIPSGMKVPFMEKVYMVKQNKKNLIPAVVHVDGSGRLQTVAKETNARYYKLIEEFHKLTGVPVILNTSFNVQGEPIVCSPTDAIKTFYSCGLDILVMGNYVIEKNEK